MPNWNMSVTMAASGDLPRTLRDSARDARTLATDLRSARTEVRELGTQSRTTSRDLDRLDRSARNAARGVSTLESSARAAARQVARIRSESGEANRNLTQLRGTSTQTGRDLQRMAGQVNSTIRDLERLATAARTVSTRMSTVGTSGARSMGRLEAAILGVHARAQGLVSLLAGGALIEGSVEMVKQGNELTQALNLFGSTSNATSMQMARAGYEANKLGADLSLPKTSAIDAADAMVELAKAGFRTDQAIDGTRASLLLSAAAQTNAADSAKYLGDMMDQFGLSADQAGKAADILAATANAASGGVTDIYYAMKYAGPIAHGLGVDMADAATGVGMLAKAGILGQTAGTSIRGMLVNMSKPTNTMSDGLKTLGIRAYDAQGNFKGLRYVIQRLQDAQKKLNQKEFLGAAAKAFGKPAVSGAVALAHQGVQSYDALSLAVRQQGAASAIAAAQGKGLAGAMVQLRTQSKTTGLAIYQGMSPGLEYITRGLTKGMATATPKITAWFKHLNNAAYLFGPDLEAEFHRVFGEIGHEASGLGGAFHDIGADAAADTLHVLLNAGKAVVTVLKNLVAGATPVVEALSDIGKDGDGVSDTLDTLVYAFDAASSAVGSASAVLVPIGKVVAGLVHDFSGLPGPVQAAILAMLLARRVTPVMTGLAGTVSGRVTPAFRGFRDEMRVQRSLAASSGVTLSRYGAAFAALETRVPVIGRMAGSFRTASAASTGFAGTLRGVTAAAGTGMRGALSGITGALGGPWGIAITAATIGLGMLAAHQQKAAQAAAEHKSDLDGLTQALQKSNGATDEAVREQAANLVQTAKVHGGQTDLIAVLNRAGYSLQQVTDAYLGQGTSLEQVAKRLDTMADAQDKAKDSAKSLADEAQADALGTAYRDSAKAIRGMKGEADEAQKKAKSLNDAINGTGTGTSAYDKLKASVSALADTTADADSRTRALKQALDLLQGGTLDYQAAELQMNTAISNANEQLADGVKKADGWGKALLNANGSVSTVTRNGQQLYGSLTDITDSTTAAAQASFSLAQSQGKDLPSSIAAARAEMQRGRDAAIKQAKAYGMTDAQAQKVADSVGLIPGQVAILLETQGVDGVLAELLAVQAQLKQTPNAHKIVVEALSSEAQAKLKALGFQISMIPGTRQFTVTVPTAGPKAALSDIQYAINQIVGKTVPINIVTTHSDLGVVAHEGGRYNKDGGVFTYYADGGMNAGRPRESHIAQIAPAGSYRVWAEKETGGESYIPLSPGKRPRSRAVAMETVRRLGGDPSSITWHAEGSVTDWRYDPMTGSLYTGADAGQAAHKTKKVTTKKGKKTTTTEVDYFDEAALEAKLRTSAAATQRWNADLTKVAERAGSDVANALAAMGTDGITLTHKMATGTTKYVNQMAASLRGLAQTARASLGDYTRQLNSATTTNAAFEQNLLKLAAQGYGDLAAQLSAQGDTAAQQLAADAAKSRSKAAAANAAAKKANNALTADQITELVRIIGSITSNRVGLHSVADTTGLGEDEVVTVAGKAAGQIKTALGSRATKFLGDLARAQKGLSYANGGIRAGMYATQSGLVRFAEPETGGEAYIPLGGNKREAATRVMTDVAHRFGLGVTAAGADRPVIVLRQDGDTNVNISTVRTGATASDIGAQVGRSVRRAKRGGVNSRG